MNLDVPSNKDAIEGVFWALYYQRGDKETVGAQRKALENLAVTWTDAFREQHRYNGETADGVVTALSGLREELSSLRDKASAHLEEQKTHFVKQVQELKRDLENTKKAFSEELALDAPVSYWATKRTHHQWVLWLMAVVTLIVASTAIYVFLCAAHTFSQKNIGQIPFLHLSTLLAISTAGIWLTRLCTKIFISNLHLRTDADERVTMIKTYLALLKTKEGPPENERQLILQTLFRPSSTGFIKEDGPAGLFELVKALNNK